MFAWSRLKSVSGGRMTRTGLAAAATLNVPDDMNLVLLTGTASVTALNAGTSTRNRIVTFIQNDSGTTTFTNTNGASTAGTMDLGGSNIALAQTDVLVLFLRSDGAWVRVTNTDN